MMAETVQKWNLFGRWTLLPSSRRATAPRLVRGSGQLRLTRHGLATEEADAGDGAQAVPPVWMWHVGTGCAGIPGSRRPPHGARRGADPPGCWTTGR